MENNELTTIEKNEITLDTPMEDLEQLLMQEKDVDKLNEIINVFNLNIKRKDIVRANKLNDLQDRITGQMSDRLTNHAGEFSNKDLLEYFKAVQDTINKADNSLSKVDTPAIQINQQNISIGEETELNRESREKVKDVISKILANSAYDLDKVPTVEATIINEGENKED